MCIRDRSSRSSLCTICQSLKDLTTNSHFSHSAVSDVGPFYYRPYLLHVRILSRQPRSSSGDGISRLPTFKPQHRNEKFCLFLRLTFLCFIHFLLKNRIFKHQHTSLLPDSSARCVCVCVCVHVYVSSCVSVHECTRVYVTVCVHVGWTGDGWVNDYVPTKVPCANVRRGTGKLAFIIVIVSRSVATHNDVHTKALPIKPG